MAFATEGYQQLVSAGVALDPQESMLEQAALQVGFELGFDEARQRDALGFEALEETTTGHSIQHRERPHSRSRIFSDYELPLCAPQVRKKHEPHRTGDPNNISVLQTHNVSNWLAVGLCVLSANCCP